MKLILVASAALAILASAPAYAQSVTGTNASTSQSGSNSSISRHGDRVNSTTAIAPSMSSTSPCVIGRSGGIGVAGTGVSLGGGSIDRDCVSREEARILSNIGSMPNGPARAAATMHLCTNVVTMRRTMVALGWCRLAQ